MENIRFRRRDRAWKTAFRLWPRERIEGRTLQGTTENTKGTGPANHRAQDAIVLQIFLKSDIAREPFGTLLGFLG